MQSKPTILINDVHTILDEKFIHQGGPSRFADLLRKVLFKQTNFNLVSFLCTDNKENSKVYTRSKKINNKHIAYELVYPRQNLLGLYKRNLTRKEIIAALSPYIDLVKDILNSAKPDLILLNGFNLTNWILMKAAASLKIPIIIQHAGIVKKEVIASKYHFSPSFRKFLYQCERDTIAYTKHHIFLSESSKRVFYKLYNVKKLSDSVIPVPIETSIFNRNKKSNVSTQLNIGMVGRWDKIKNHQAILRLAESRFKPDNWHIHVVTRIPDITKSEIGRKYNTLVTIHNPLSPKELAAFYASMDICILPSRFETAGMVVAEAILCGTPTIISDQTGWVETYKKFGLQSHIISPYISGKKLVITINHIISSSTYKNKYKRLQEYLTDVNNPDMVIKQYLHIFSRFL